MSLLDNMHTAVYALGVMCGLKCLHRTFCVKPHSLLDFCSKLAEAFWEVNMLAGFVLFQLFIVENAILKVEKGWATLIYLSFNYKNH